MKRIWQNKNQGARFNIFIYEKEAFAEKSAQIYPSGKSSDQTRSFDFGRTEKINQRTL